MRLAVDLSLTSVLRRGAQGWRPARLFRGGAQGFWYAPGAPGALYLDVAGTQPVTAPMQSVALMRDFSGNGRHASQATTSARPTFARAPAGGVRNRANGSAAVGNAAFWPASFTQNGLSMTKVGSGIDAQGRSFADLRYQGMTTGTFHSQTYSIANAMIPATVGTTVTGSFFVEMISGTGAGITGVVVDIAEISAAGTTLAISKGAPGLPVGVALASHTRTASNAACAAMRCSIVVTLASGVAVDVTFRITALQFEQGTARTAWQANQSQFDVAEAGVRDTYWLAGNGVNHFMSLVAPFAPAGGYTIAVVMAGPSEAILGATDTSAARLFSAPAGEILYRANEFTNQITTGANPVVTGRHVIIIRVSGAGTGQIFVNGLPVTSFVTGNLIPTQAISTLMRSTTRFSAARMAGAVLVDRAIDDADIQMLYRYLLAKGGIAL